MDKQKRKSWGISRFFQGKAGKKFLVFLEILLAAAFFVQPHLYYDGTAPVFFNRFYADSLLICGGLWGLLVFLTVKEIPLRPQMNRWMTRATAALTPFVAFLWLENYNHLQFWGPISRIPGWYLFLDLLIYYVIYLFFLLVFNSVRGASVAMIIATAFFGIMNYELTVFRSMSFIASDLYSLLTAVSVANTYKMDIDVTTAEFFLLALVILALLLKLKGKKLFRWKGRAIYGLLFAAVFAGFCQVYVCSDYLEDIGVDFRVYRPQYKYRFYGTMLTTVRTFGYLHVEEPEGYSVEAVKEIIASVEKKQTARQDPPPAVRKEKPNILVIMNESFADLKEVGNLEVTRDYMPFFRKLKENVIKGYTYSSVFGGNTANTEFEFLTGNTMAFLPDNSVPYQLFLREEIPGLTSTLKAQGYGPLLALHPYYQTGYSRYKIYPLMSFDRFYTSDDFSVFSDTVNYHITDEENYRKIIKLYEEAQNAKEEKPFYLFNVTMQNHGSYDGNTFETGNSVQIKGGAGKDSQAEQYLNMIKMSDKALEKLIRYFEKEEKPTVIVFFGDHQPDLDENFYEQLLGKPTGELEGEELQKLYKVPFLIWANYDIEEKTLERTSNNYLTTYLADVAGLEKTGYLQFLTEIREENPCINAIGYWGKDGKFYEREDKASPYYPLLQQYHLLEYNQIFGKDEQEKEFFSLVGK